MPSPELPDEALPLWVIYKNPTDIPAFPPPIQDTFVVRRMIVGPGTTAHDPQYARATSLNAARAKVRIEHPGAFNLGRADDDDPVIVEVWI